MASWESGWPTPRSIASTDLGATLVGISFGSMLDLGMMMMMMMMMRTRMRMRMRMRLRLRMRMRRSSNVSLPISVVSNILLLVVSTCVNIIINIHIPKLEHVNISTLSDTKSFPTTKPLGSWNTKFPSWTPPSLPPSLALVPSLATTPYSSLGGQKKGGWGVNGNVYQWGTRSLGSWPKRRCDLRFLLVGFLMV